MNPMKLFLILLLAIGVAGGCNHADSEASDRLLADMSANLREMSDILTSVTDEASAHAAVPRIEAVRERMRECARRARELPRPDPATEQRQNEAMQAVMVEVMPKIAGAQARLAERPELLAILAPAMQGMENDL